MTKSMTQPSLKSHAWLPVRQVISHVFLDTFSPIAPADKKWTLHLGEGDAKNTAPLTKIHTTLDPFIFLFSHPYPGQRHTISVWKFWGESTIIHIWKLGSVDIATRLPLMQSYHNGCKPKTMACEIHVPGAQYAKSYGLRWPQN